MTTSASNRISPNTEVTPDCVIQIDDKSGLIAEAKLSLPKDETLWHPAFDQLAKYDDDLTGWWTSDELIKTHDIVALVPLSRAVRFGDCFEEACRAKTLEFGRKVAVVGFFKQSGVKNFLTLKKERGLISNRILDQRLRESLAIDFSLLIREYGDRKFVEHMPPLPYVLQILWDNLFLKYAAEVPKDESKGWHLIKVSVNKITSDLQENYGFKSLGARSSEIPRPSFVQKALDALVDFNIAERSDDGEYLIKYKRSRKDTLEKFGRLCSESETKKLKRKPSSTPLLIGL